MAVAALPMIVLALSAATTAVGVAGAVAQGQAASQAAKFNQKVADNNATAARQQADFQANQKDLQLRRVLADQTAAGASNGVTGGSLTDVAFSTAQQGKLDQLATRYQGAVAAGNFNSQSQLQGLAGQNAQTNMLFQAGGTALSGAASATGAYNQMQGTGYQPSSGGSYDDMPEMEGY